MRLMLHGHTQYFEILTSLAWWGIQPAPVIPVPGRQRWKGRCKLDASLIYIVNSILARDIQIIRSWVWLWLYLLMLALALLCLFVWYQIIILRRNSKDYKGLLSSFKDLLPWRYTFLVMSPYPLLLKDPLWSLYAHLKQHLSHPVQCSKGPNRKFLKGYRERGETSGALPGRQSKSHWAELG